MAAQVLVMPASPALVRELSPRDTEAREIREQVRAVVSGPGAGLPIELVGSRNPRWLSAHEGSFAAWGAPTVRVGAGNHLPELVQRYVLGEAAARVTQARGRLEPLNPEALTIVALDGSAGMTARAPLALLETAPWADRWCRELLSGTRPEPATNAELRAAGIVEPDLWLELWGFNVSSGRLLYAGDAGGVGRFVAHLEITVLRALAERSAAGASGGVDNPRGRG